ncbi:MAG: SDR family oxidoreductase [Bacteroidetes bacterium]|nr:SDR family oxidoreductase [Bacteroidota bacterium]
MTSTTISILGCGYVGHPLAKLLVNQGWRVRGATTQKQKLSTLLADGIEPYLLKLTPSLIGHGKRDFFDSDVMVINFPPGRKRPNVIEFLGDAMDSLLGYLSQGDVKKVIFISSTSVYASGHVQESDAGNQIPGSASGVALLKAENTLLEASAFETTILRFAGLYGYERSPGKFWSGRVLCDPHNAVNMLHRDDAVGVVLEIIYQNYFEEVFNVCAEQHPSRAEFYLKAALNQGIPPPLIQESEPKNKNKIVLTDKLRTLVGYRFKYPDPLSNAP